MQLNKTGKIVVAVIAGVAAVGIMHVLLFRDQAQEYNRAVSSFEQVAQRYVDQGIPPESGQLHRFRYETLRNKLDYWETLRDMRLALPEYFDDEGVADEQRQQEEIWSILERLEELRDQGEAGQGPRLAFMGERAWDIRASLPSGVPTGSTLAQRIQELWARSRTLDVLGGRLEGDGRTQRRTGMQAPTAEERRLQLTRQRLETEYRQLLRQVGLDLQAREVFTDRFGSLYSTLHTLNRVRLVNEALPAGFWDEYDEEERLERLYQVFRLEWPKDNLGNVNFLPGYRQGLALIEMIETAAEEGIPEIEFVRAHDIRSMTYVPPRDEEEDEDEMMDPGMMWDPAMMMDPMLMDPMMMEFMDPMMMEGMDLGMMGMMGMVQEEPDDIVATIAPVELIVRGNTENVMRYMYRLNNKRRPFELDRFRFRRVPDQDGQVRFQGFYNVSTYAMYLGLMQENYVEYNIVNSRRELAELAQQQAEAVRDLALRDGILTQVGDVYELAEPTPTPYPTPEGGFPDFAPPEPEPAMDPSMMDPSMMDPGMMDPGMMDPGMMDPGMMPGEPAQPEPAQPEPGPGLEGLEGVF